MAHRSVSQLCGVLTLALLGACASGEQVAGPETEVLASAGAPGPGSSVTLASACNTTLEVVTTGKVKQIAAGSRILFTFPQATTRITNKANGASVTVVSTGSFAFRLERGLPVVDLRGRNILIDERLGTATLYVGLFTERGDVPNVTRTGTGQVIDLCTQVAG